MKKDLPSSPQIVDKMAVVIMSVLPEISAVEAVDAAVVAISAITLSMVPEEYSYSNKNVFQLSKVDLFFHSARYLSHFNSKFNSGKSCGSAR